MIAFGMKTTLVRYEDKYYNYKGVVGGESGNEEQNEDENGLAIGAYEAAFCADVSAAYIYEKSEKLLKKLRYAGSYRNDGLAIFNHRLSTKQAIHWLRRFQLQVDKLVGGSFFQFTAEVWNPPGNNESPTYLDTIDEETMSEEEWSKWKKKVKVVTEEAFPYLDMQDRKSVV